MGGGGRWASWHQGHRGDRQAEAANRVQGGQDGNVREVGRSGDRAGVSSRSRSRGSHRSLGPRPAGHATAGHVCWRGTDPVAPQPPPPPGGPLAAAPDEHRDEVDADTSAPGSFFLSLSLQSCLPVSREVGGLAAFPCCLRACRAPAPGQLRGPACASLPRVSVRLEMLRSQRGHSNARPRPQWGTCRAARPTQTERACRPAAPGSQPVTRAHGYGPQSVPLVSSAVGLCLPPPGALSWPPPSSIIVVFKCRAPPSHPTSTGPIPHMLPSRPTCS